MHDAASLAERTRIESFSANLFWTLTIQGELVNLQAHQIESKAFTQKPRGNIVDFSPASRIRMLKFISRLDWSRIGRGSFITLTYPDAVLPMGKERRKQALYVFFRSMENHLQRQTCGLWRTEWKPRQSGAYRGICCPHLHLIVPNIPFIQKETIRQWWASAIAYEGQPMTRIDALTDRTKHAVYIAKYSAKVTDNSGLDYHAYRNIDGRHWGYKRPSLLPMHPKLTYNDLDEETVLRLRTLASSVLKHYDKRYDPGFSLFGKVAQKNLPYVLKFLLDAGSTPE